MTSKFIRALTAVLWDSDLIASRFTIALAELCWGIILLLPGQSFTDPSYVHLLSVMSEIGWGILFLILGVIQFNILAANDLNSKKSRLFAGITAIVWSYVVIGVILSVYPPTVMLGGEIAMVFSSIWIWVRPYLLAEGYHRYVIRPRQ